jgi:hypothetical protein
MAQSGLTAMPDALSALGAKRRCAPGRGTFHFEISVMPPLTKTCPKMVLPIKGGSLSVKAVCKKIFWYRERFRWRRARIVSSETL